MQVFGRKLMTMKYRILIALGILLVDFAAVVVPLTAIFLSYIVIYNPPWFRKFLNDMDDTGDMMGRAGKGIPG